jgi:hypothetical protein
MITDADIKKMKKVFATKDDLKKLAKQKDLLEVKKKLQELSDYAVPALGNIFRWTDDIHTAVTGKKSSHAAPEN